MEEDESYMVVEDDDDTEVQGKQQHLHHQGLYLTILLVASAFISLAVSIATIVIYFEVRMENEKPDHIGTIINRASRLVHRSYTTYGNRRAYAHKLLVSASDVKTGNGRVKLMINHETNGINELSRGVTLLREGITINQPGNYYIYTNIQMSLFERQTCEQLGYQNFTSFLIVSSAGGSSEKCLFESAHACCPTCYDVTETAFNGGVFHLRQGDVVQVEVGAPFLEKFETGGDITYMGLMMFNG